MTCWQGKPLSRHSLVMSPVFSTLSVKQLVCSAAHGSNVDGSWLRAGAPRQLRKGAVMKFGASSREYKVRKALADDITWHK